MLQEDIALIQKDAKALKDSVLQNGPFTNNLVSKAPDNIEEADIYEASRRIKQFQEELDHLNDSVGKVEDDLSGFSSSEQAVQTKEMM